MYKRQQQLDASRVLQHLAYQMTGRSDAGRTIGQLARIVPVSYTHLRAHETVLDLVCRLLLEKKKKKIT